MTLGKRLVFLRESLGMKQLDVAKALGISKTVFNRYEKDARFPDINTLITIADYYDCSLDYLVGRCNVKYFFQEESADMLTLLNLASSLPSEALKDIIQKMRLLEDDAQEKQKS